MDLQLSYEFDLYWFFSPLNSVFIKSWILWSNKNMLSSLFAVFPLLATCAWIFLKVGKISPVRVVFIGPTLHLMKAGNGKNKSLRKCKILFLNQCVIVKTVFPVSDTMLHAFITKVDYALVEYFLSQIPPDMLIDSWSLEVQWLEGGGIRNLTPFGFWVFLSRMLNVLNE